MDGGLFMSRWLTAPFMSAFSRRLACFVTLGVLFTAMDWIARLSDAQAAHAPNASREGS
jgi:hypothetical protein